MSTLKKRNPEQWKILWRIAMETDVVPIHADQLRWLVRHGYVSYDPWEPSSGIRGRLTEKGKAAL